MNRRLWTSLLCLLVALAVAPAPAARAAGSSSAVDDFATVHTGGHTTIDLAANDDLSGPAPHTFTLELEPVFGTASLDPGTGVLDYTAGDTEGREELAYDLVDSDGSTTSAALYIDVTDSIVSSGPLTKVLTSPDLNCAVHHVGDSSGEFFDDTACGTFAVVDSTMYSPANIPAGAPGTPWTPVSQSQVTGSGSNADPLRRTTVVDAGDTGVRLTQVDSYVVGQESYRTDVTVRNSGTARTVRLYRAGDCFLADSDTGLGAKDAASGSVSCVSSADGSSRVEQFQPLSAGSHFYEDEFDSVWAQISDKLAFPDTCACDTQLDNGAGLSWDIDLLANETRTRSSLITFSPTGALPLTTTKTVDHSSVAPGATVSYTITVHNPGVTPEQLSSVTDDLPTGFGYVPGSTTGASSSNPTSAGGALTWSTAASVAPGADATLTFEATSSSTPGTYYNNAGGTATDVFVAPTGNTAPVIVSQAADTTPPAPVTQLHAVPGDGQVDLTWDNPTDADLDHVVLVYRAGPDAPTSPTDGTVVSLSGAKATDASVPGLVNGQDYTFAVFAVDASDNVSDPASVTATPVAPGDVSPVSNLQVAGAGTGAAVLTWLNPSQLDGIMVRVSTTAEPTSPTDGGPVQVTGTPQTVTVPGLQNGQTYYFSVFATLGNAVSSPESVSFTPYTCPNLTGDLDAPAGLVTGQSWVACSAPDANEAGNLLHTVLPRTGPTQALMTSGQASLAAPGDDSTGAGRDNQTGSRGAQDVSIYKVDLDVPAGSSCLTFDYVFASEEYPEYVGQSFNDGFLAQLDQNQWTVDADSAIVATGNFAKIGDSYVSVNSPVFAQGATVYLPDTNGTSYDGMSVPLQARTPITPGAHSIYLSIFDAGDGILDSAAFVDHLRTSTAGCSAGSNQQPVAQDDTATTDTLTPVTTPVLDNDTDGDHDPLTIVGHTDGTHGTVVCSTTCTYTPNSGGYTGGDSYTYTVGDGNGGTDTATVTVTITNQPPVAHDDTATTSSGTAKVVPVVANDTDADGHALSVTGHTAPLHGTVTCAATACTYTSVAGYSGPDSFDYTVSDGHGGTSTATVSISVTAANHKPDAVNDSARAVGSAPEQVDVLANDTDADHDMLTIVAHSTPTHGSVSCTTTCTYTAPAGYHGTTSFTYTVSDGHGGSDTATVTMTVPTLHHVAISVDHPALLWPQSVTVRGVALTSLGEPIKGISMRLWAKPSGGSYAAVTGQLVTGADGVVTSTKRPVKGTTYQWRVSSPAVSSPGTPVTVTPALTAHGSTTRLASGATLTITGRASPVRSGAPVRLQQRVGSSWSTMQSHTFSSGSTSTTSGASYSFSITKAGSGVYSFRVLLPADSGRRQTVATVPDVTFYKAVITHVQGAGDEYVQVKNTGSVTIDLAGWKLKNASGVARVLPAQTLAAGSSVRVHSGTGTGTATDVFLNGAAFLGNAHDTVRLFDNRGTRTSTYSY